MRSMILAAFILSACSSVVPSTAMRLSGISPATADPAGIASRLDLPAGIGVLPGSARLLYRVARADIGAVLEEAFVLTQEGDVFQIAPADHARLRAAQDQTLAWQAASPDDTVGTLAVTLIPCRLDDGSAPDARVSVNLRLAPDGSFLPLLRDAPLSAVTSNEVLAAISDCP